MYLVLFLFILLAITATFSGLFKKRFEETLPTTVLSITLIMYICSILSSLKVGYYAVIALAILAVGLSVYYLVKYKKQFFNRYLTPGFLFFILFFGFIWWAHRGRLLTQWDEFSHWGLTVKNMFTLDVLGNQEIATTTFKSYPPAIALFQYFLQKLSGVFIESNLYRAINVFNIALLISILKFTNWKEPKKFLMLAFIVLVTPLAFYYEFYHTIYVDATLGVIFGYILYMYFSEPLSKFNLLNLTLAFMVLILTKETGFGLAAIALVIMIPDLVINGVEVKSFLNQNRYVNKAMLILPLFGILFAKYSWSFYLKVCQTNSYWGEPGVTLQKVLNLYADDQPAYRKQTMINFFNALFTDKVTGFILDFNFVGCLLIFILLGMILVYLTKKQNQKRMKWAIRLSFVGCIIFAASLLSVYLFTYNEAEATGLASLVRYLGTYLTGFFIFLIYMIISTNSNQSKKIKSYLLPACLVFLFIFINIKPLLNCTILAPYYIDQSVETRSDYYEMDKVLDVIDPLNDRVYLITQNNRPGHLTARYILTPIHINTYEYSLGEPYSGTDLYTWNLSVEEWASRLNNYDYVYLHRIDEKFINTYGILFEEGITLMNDTLYRVVKDNGTIRLEHVLIP